MQHMAFIMHLRWLAASTIRVPPTQTDKHTVLL